MMWWVFGLIFLVLGIIFLLVGIVAMKRAKTAQTWPSLPGVVVRSEVVRHESTDSDGDTSTSYEPVVYYEYAVMGTPFTGKRIAFGANSFNYKKAAEICARYPMGGPATVHYNPEKPQDAVLETSASGGKLFIIVGAIFSVVGVVGLIAELLS